MKTSRKPYSLIMLGVLVLVCLHSFFTAQTAALQAATSCVVVNVKGIRNTKGKVLIGLWKSKDGFPKDRSKALNVATVEIINGTATTMFRDLPHGDYAVATYHDENNNGKMDTNLFGVPTEGVGTSNDAHRGFSAPSFDQCRFGVSEPEKVISINMHY
jgi:uncharacterized protein (DUF2141 family)